MPAKVAKRGNVVVEVQKRGENAVETSPERGAIARNSPAIERKPYSLTIKLPGLPKTANGSHGHWRAVAAEKKRWKQKVFTAAWPYRPSAPLEHALIECTRFSSVEPDEDNLVISFKACVDGLKQAGVIKDDKRKNVTRKYMWERAPRNAGRIVIRVSAGGGGA